MKNTLMKIFAAAAYLAMVAVNFLANSLPINNRSTGEISDAYPNLFAPAGLAFSIWGLIYLLLGVFVLYQFTKDSQVRAGFLAKINFFFIVSSLANLAWIFAWHYDLIGLSVLIMAVLLASLIKIADRLRVENFTAREKFFLATPFHVYFGWITVAAIANITVFLVGSGWNGFGLPDFVWTSIILLVGALIGILRMRKDRNIAYGLVLVWAYLGILLKHFSASGFDRQYPSVMATVAICLALFGFYIGRIVIKNQSIQSI